MSLSRSTRISARLLVPAVAAAALLLPQTSSPARAEDPVAGAQTSGDAMFPNVGNGGYDAQHYDIDLAWTPTGSPVLTPGVPPVVALDATISATASMRAVTTGAPLSSYSLDFEGPSLTVSSVTVNGEPATWTRDEDPMAIRHKLVVTPATPVSGSFTTVVTYAGTPNRHVDADMSYEGWNVTADGATFVNQPVGAMTGYPHNNTPNDKATYTFDLDIPNTITNSGGTGAAAAASNGELVDRVPNGPDRTTWRWVQQRPMASELTIISIGKYDVLEGSVSLTDGTVIPEYSFVDSSLSSANKATIDTRRGQIGAITRNLEQIFGPYPGGSTGVVVDVVPSNINYALETQDRSFFPSTGSVAGNTLIHEIAHQWYGNNVAPTVWTDIWINEGMATWAPTYHNNVLATAPLTTSANSTHSVYYSSWNNGAASSYATPPGAQTSSATLYGYQTYTRSAQMWEALKLSIGDKAFLAFLEEWQARYAGQSRGFAAFKALAEEVSGEDLQAFFQDWILDGDKPAWPQRYDLGLTAAPAAGPLAPGDTVTYTLSAANMGRVPLSPAGGAASVAEVDLADVLDDATIDTASLPAGLTLDGTTLTWAVPTTAVGTFATGAASPTAPAPTSTVSFPVAVKATASLDTLAASATSATLGGFCGPEGCATTADVPVQPLTPTAQPVVTGDPRVGAPLGVDTSGWAAGTTFAYQWAVGSTPVDGAAGTGSTFTPRPADLGETLTVAVTGSHPDYTPVTRTSEPSAPVAEGELTAATPTVAGAPRVDVVLTADPGTWTPGTAFAYQWSVGGVPVEGATASTFTPRPADVGTTVTVAVTGTASGYTPTTRTSEPTAPVALGTFTRTATPSVVGRPTVGVPLTAQTGTWDAGTTFAYQWRVDGVAVEGATGAEFTPRPADVGQVVTVSLTGSKPGYASVTRTSSDGPAVAPGTQGETPTPMITGTPQVGETLTAAPGTWDQATTLTYQWSVAGRVVTGATSPTFTPRPADVGSTVTVAVTGTRPGHATVTRTSDPSAPVARGVLVATAPPSISGTPRVGSVLTGGRGTWPAGTSFSYQWLVGGEPVAGATEATYTPRAGDLGETVRFVVTATQAGYDDATTASAASAPVVAGRLDSTPVPTVTGPRRVGTTLTATPGAWDDGVTLTYLWVRNGFGIPGADGPSYALTPADRGTVVRVVVTGDKPGYTSVSRVSDRPAPVGAGRLTRRPTPTIAGRPVVGATLRARPGTHDAGVSLAFRWLVGGRAVAGPRGGAQSYAPRPADRGKRVKVRVVASKPGYAPVARTSGPSRRVG